MDIPPDLFGPDLIAQIKKFFPDCRSCPPVFLHIPEFQQLVFPVQHGTDFFRNQPAHFPYTFDSITEEECPTTIISWLKQRSRWLKGFAQTFCEHLLLSRPITSNIIIKRYKFHKISQIGISNILIFYVFIAMSFFSFIFLIVFQFNEYLVFDINNVILNNLILINTILIIIIFYMSFICVCIKNRIKFNIIYFLLFPLYWCLHYIAMIKSLYSLLCSPFYWSKTEHGVSKTVKSK